jgi:hypothetical protein
VNCADVVPAQVWADPSTVQHQCGTRNLPRVLARGIRHRVEWPAGEADLRR